MKTTKEERDKMRVLIAESTTTGNMVMLPSGGGFLTEVMNELDEALAVLDALLGMVEAIRTGFR